MLLCQLPNQSTVFEKKSFLTFRCMSLQSIPNKLEANRIDILVPSFSGRFCSALFYAYIAVSTPSSGGSGGFGLFAPAISLGSCGSFFTHKSPVFSPGSHHCGGAGADHFRVRTMGSIYGMRPNYPVGTNHTAMGTIGRGAQVKHTPWMRSPGAPIAWIHPIAPWGDPRTVGRCIHEPNTRP
jgi:hypothetical protein